MLFTEQEGFAPYWKALLKKQKVAHLQRRTYETKYKKKIKKVTQKLLAIDQSRDEELPLLVEVCYCSSIASEGLTGSVSVKLEHVRKYSCSEARIRGMLINWKQYMWCLGSESNTMS